MDLINMGCFHCMECGARKARLVHDKKNNKIVCEDRDTCLVMQQMGENNL